MKRLILVSLVLFVATCSGRGRLEGFSNTETINSSKCADGALLELITHATGAAYPREGPILQMRLCENGQFEYDDFPDYDPPKHSTKNASVVRKTATLSKVDFEELLALTGKPDLLSADQKYESLQTYTDTLWTTTLRIKRGDGEKSITAVNIWGALRDAELARNYPPSLLQLLEKIELTKAKTIGRTSYQWLPRPQSAPSTGPH